MRSCHKAAVADDDDGGASDYDVDDEVGDCGPEVDDAKRRGSAAQCSAL